MKKLLLCICLLVFTGCQVQNPTSQATETSTPPQIIWSEDDRTSIVCYGWYLEENEVWQELDVKAILEQFPLLLSLMDDWSFEDGRLDAIETKTYGTALFASAILRKAEDTLEVTIRHKESSEIKGRIKDHDVEEDQPYAMISGTTRYGAIFHGDYVYSFASSTLDQAVMEHLLLQLYQAVKLS